MKADGRSSLVQRISSPVEIASTLELNNQGLLVLLADRTLIVLRMTTTFFEQDSVFMPDDSDPAYKPLHPMSFDGALLTVPVNERTVEIFRVTIGQH